MRMNRKSLTLALALTAVLAAASPALAASREKAGAGEPNVIERLIQSIKRHFLHTTDDVIVLPPPLRN